MKVYKVSLDLTKRTVVKWCGTQAEVKAATKEFAERYGAKKGQTKEETIEIPWDKAGHLAWLNENLGEIVKRPDGEPS